MKTYCLEVSGDFACFTRPETHLAPCIRPHATSITRLKSRVRIETA